MTQKIYETDSYVQSFTARVLQCSPAPGGFAVVLDRTAFFPEGGGQPCDTGTLGGARVLAVSTDGETVTHTTDAPLPEGTEVTGCLNWAARLDAMQQHTGEHILSGTLHRLFGAENVGFHIGSPYVRMDTSIPLTAAQLAEAEAEANAAVRADTPVHCWVPDPEALACTDYRSKKALEGPVRLVEAGGDRCACCGTHLARTGEVGLIKIISYAQGYTLMRTAAKTYGWNLNYGGIALMWRGGCIIRSVFLGKIKEAYDKNPELSNLLLDPYFKSTMEKLIPAWRKVAAAAVSYGVPAPAMTAALSYFDGYTTDRLPANLLQAQRDYFGAHTYERLDSPRGQFFHTNWTGHGGNTAASTYNA